jgi:hypothetical protein
LVVLSSSPASADRKSFGHTYEYATLPEGQTELEIWHTELRDTTAAASAQRFEEKLEIEHGITDHWDISMYTVLAQVAGGQGVMDESLGLDGIRFETRYRFADRGELPVDTVAYFEVAKDFGTSVYELEAKGIFARDFDRLTVAGNIIGEVQLGKDVPETQLELGWAVGASYELSAKWRAGVETWGQHQGDETRASVGPAIGWAPSSKLWVVLSGGFGVATEQTADLGADLGAYSGRIIIGIGL